MTTYYEYTLKCITEGVDKSWILDSTKTAPTTCPTDTTHTVSATVRITDTISNDTVTIKEESTPTGGHFGSTTVRLDAIKGTITTASVSWPYPISALSVGFFSEETHRGDMVDMHVGENTIIGGITGSVSSASGWVNQNYTVGQIVTYNGKPYTCSMDTVSNEVPIDTRYWKYGFGLNVQATVTANTALGYYIQLDDLTNVDVMGRVVEVDAVNGKIYVEDNPTNSYSPMTPTYVRQTARVITGYELAGSCQHTIGSKKIGGSYIPRGTTITLRYENKSVDTDKVLVGVVEYLY